MYQILGPLSTHIESTLKPKYIIQEYMDPLVVLNLGVAAFDLSMSLQGSTGQFRVGVLFLEATVHSLPEPLLLPHVPRYQRILEAEYQDSWL